MPEAIPTVDRRLDVLAERAKRIRRLARDGITKLVGEISQAYSCPNAGTCTFGDVVPTGGAPCSECRRLTEGDYYIQEPKEK